MAIYDALGYAEELRSKEQTVVTSKHLELSIGVYSRDSLRDLVLAWLLQHRVTDHWVDIATMNFQDVMDS